MMTGSPGFLLESHPFKISPRSRVPSLGSPATSVHFPSETPCCQAADPLGTATITDFCHESHCGLWEGQVISLWLLHLKCHQALPTDFWRRDSFPTWLCQSSAAEEGRAWESSSWLGPTHGTPAGSSLTPGAGPSFPPMTGALHKAASLLPVHIKETVDSRKEKVYPHVSY